MIWQPSAYIWEQEHSEYEVFRDSVRALLADSAYMAVTVRLDEERSIEEPDLHEPIETQKPEDGEELPEAMEPELPVDLESDIEELLEVMEPELPADLESDIEELPEAMEPEASIDSEADAEEHELESDEVRAPVKPVEEADQADAEESPADHTGEYFDDDVTEEASPAERAAVDTVSATAADTVPVSRSIRAHFQEIIDKSLPEPDFSDLFPYEGALWDSARVVLISLRNDYSDFPRSRIVNALAEEIEVDRVRVPAGGYGTCLRL
jgi:hypothetical protein